MEVRSLVALVRNHLCFNSCNNDPMAGLEIDLFEANRHFDGRINIGSPVAGRNVTGRFRQHNLSRMEAAHRTNRYNTDLDRQLDPGRLGDPTTRNFFPRAPSA
jgi:hypothetical protein